MIKLAPFNNLTPKPEYLEHVLSLFDIESGWPLSKIIQKSSLTRTQTLSAVEALLKQKKIMWNKMKNVFYLSFKTG